MTYDTCVGADQIIMTYAFTQDMTLKYFLYVSHIVQYHSDAFILSYVQRVGALPFV